MTRGVASAQSATGAVAAKWIAAAAVEIDEVRRELIDRIDYAMCPLRRVPAREITILLQVAVRDSMRQRIAHPELIRIAREVCGERHVILEIDSVEILQVETELLPPRVLSVVVLRTVVRHALERPIEIAQESRLIPPQRIVAMKRDAEPDAFLVGRLLPTAEDVAVRAYLHRIPRLIFRVPQIKIVVMHPLPDHVAPPARL